MSHPGTMFRLQLLSLLEAADGKVSRLAGWLGANKKTVEEWLAKTDDELARVQNRFHDKIREVAEARGLRLPTASSIPLWDPAQPYLVNLERPVPTPLDLPEPPSVLRTMVAGYEVRSPFGSGASVITSNAKRIRYLARSGCDVITYKTVRSNYHQGHGSPNILACPAAELDPDSGVKQQLVVQELSPDFRPKKGMMNRFGMPCLPVEQWQLDFRRAMDAMEPGQLLILSIVGTADRKASATTLIEDFANVARLARDAGARVIEANFSCPNCEGREGSVYTDPDLARKICRAIAAAVPDVKLLVKVGYLTRARMEDLVRATAPFVAGFCEMNTLSAEVLRRRDDGTTYPAFLVPGVEAGISGAPIHRYALRCVETLLDVLAKEGASDLSVIASGGVCTPADVEAFLTLGADAVMATTAFFEDEAFGEKVQAHLAQWKKEEGYEIQRELERAHRLLATAAQKFGGFHNAKVAAAANEVWQDYIAGVDQIRKTRGAYRPKDKITAGEFERLLGRKINGLQQGFFGQ
jgi:dihydroorotate dehydrogenase (NAD+) catalytic subunit